MHSKYCLKAWHFLKALLVKIVVIKSTHILVLWLIFSCSYSFAETLTFRFDDTNARYLKLVSTLQAQGVFDKLKNFSNQNLQLKAEVTFVLYEGDGLFYDAAQNEVLIPYQQIIELYEGVAAKYPQQPGVSVKIFSSAVEQLLWFEFGRVLVNQYSLPILGREEFTLDNFSTLMLLNLGDLESEYILDAAEEYLLVDDAKSLADDTTFQNEMEFDQQRYRTIVCMVLGQDDYSGLVLLKEFAWDKERLAKCRDRYVKKLNAWYTVLSPHLKPGNHMQRWVRSWKIPYSEIQATQH